MNNMILKTFSAENFSSFADEVIFTTAIDDTKKEYLQNTFECNDERFNKVSFVYGANGTGKTYFCKILREIQRLLTWSPLSTMSNSNDQILLRPEFKALDRAVDTFTFDEVYKERPTRFKIEIVINKTTYHYEFAIRREKLSTNCLQKSIVEQRNYLKEHLRSTRYTATFRA